MSPSLEQATVTTSTPPRRGTSRRHVTQRCSHVESVGSLRGQPKLSARRSQHERHRRRRRQEHVATPKQCLCRPSSIKTRTIIMSQVGSVKANMNTQLHSYGQNTRTASAAIEVDPKCPHVNQTASDHRRRRSQTCVATTKAEPTSNTVEQEEDKDRRHQSKM